MARPNPAPTRRPSGARSVRQPRPVSDDERLARRLAATNGKCPSCGYSLKGLPGVKCPECGLELTASRVEFRVAHWRCPPFFVGAAGLVLGLVPAVFAAWVIVSANWTMAVGTDYSDRFNMFILIAWVAGVVKLFIEWINWSGTMAAWPRAKHWVVAAACWLAPVGGVGVAYVMGVFNL